MAGQVEDGVEDPFIGYAFVADHLDQLTPKAFVPVSIFVCSHSGCKIKALLNICFVLFELYCWHNYQKAAYEIQNG
jgi:hypothetical protein